MSDPITPDERAAMREHADRLYSYGGESQEASEDILRLLDALDTAEAEVARLRAATSPVWDEDAVREDVTVALRRLLPMTQEPALSETANVLAVTVLAALRDHLPVKPSRESRAQVEAAALREAANALARMDDGREGGYYDAGRHSIARIRAHADRIEKEK